MGSQYFNYIILGIAVLLFLVTLLKDWHPFSGKKTPSSTTEETKNENDRERPVAHPVKNDREILLPLCLQAYERLVVFLERIRLESLIKRLNQSGLNVQETEQLLITSIRSEFEHNISQQIYVSTPSWEAVSSAKEQLIRVIHIAASKLSADESGNVLCKELLSQSFPNNDSPVSIALEILNSEAKKLMRFRTSG